MQTLKILILRLLSVVFVIFAIIFATISKEGAITAIIAAAITWPTAGEKIAKATGKKWLAPVAGLLLAFIVAPIIANITRPSDAERAAIEEQKAVIEAQRTASKEVAEINAKKERIAKAEKEASERTRNNQRNAEMTEIKLQRLAREFIKTGLKDPSSAQFRNQKGVCGEINAKNSFGGFTGFRRFVAVSEEMVFIEGEALSGSGFQQIWDKACK